MLLDRKADHVMIMRDVRRNVFREACILRLRISHGGVSHDDDIAAAVDDVSVWQCACMQPCDGSDRIIVHSARLLGMLDEPSSSL